MILSIRSSVILVTVVFVQGEVYFHNTNGRLNVEYYDCAFIQCLFFCRRTQEPIDLFRDNDMKSCEQTGGRLHRFSELQAKNISSTTILDQWKSGLERVEQYSRYLRGCSRTEWIAT